VIKNKNILFSTLFFTWAIIFVHSIIPHNHHNEPTEECCTHSHASHSLEISFSGIFTSFSTHDHHSEDANHCHFNISTTLTKFVDSAGIYFYTGNSFIPLTDQITSIQYKNQNLLVKHFYFDSFTHRGPPSIS
jgi:hypothetical protein